MSDNLTVSDQITVTDQIAEIESRQDQVLRQLDELNLLLERAIAEWMGKPGQAKTQAPSAAHSLKIA